MSMNPISSKSFALSLSSLLSIAWRVEGEYVNEPSMLAIFYDNGHDPICKPILHANKRTWMQFGQSLLCKYLSGKLSWT